MIVAVYFSLIVAVATTAPLPGYFHVGIGSGSPYAPHNPYTQYSEPLYPPPSYSSYPSYPSVPIVKTVTPVYSTPVVKTVDPVFTQPLIKSVYVQPPSQPITIVKTVQPAATSYATVTHYQPVIKAIVAPPIYKSYNLSPYSYPYSSHY